MPVLLSHDDLHQLFLGPEETLGLVDAADAALRGDKPPQDRENKCIVVPLQAEGAALVGASDNSSGLGVTLRAQVRGPNGRPLADSEGSLLVPVLLFDAARAAISRRSCARGTWGERPSGAGISHRPTRGQPAAEGLLAEPRYPFRGHLV